MEYTTGSNLSPVDATIAARKLWLSATAQCDLDEVERLYRWALSSKEPEHSSTNHQHRDDEDIEKNTTTNGDGPPKKKKKSGRCGLNKTQFNQAGEKLALLLCQSGRCKKAKKGLTSMGFTCRLAKEVLDYPYEDESDQSNTNHEDDATVANNTEIKEKKASTAICQIVDGFLSPEELKRLRSVFESPTARYWTDHNYAVEPPSPYFSYVMPLADICVATESNGKKRTFGFIGDLAQKIMECPLVNEKFPKLQSKANFVEFWAHNRPHASGHQMHFDSDDEGRGGIRNPIISTIIYITAENTTINNGKHGRATGGPSLVTNQKLSDIRLATKGYFAHPKSQRLVAFDGRYLHGVVPGKGVEGGRRVTLMLAFWENIQIRRGEGPGSARPFPNQDDDLPKWASQLVQPLEDSDINANDYGSCVEKDPIKLDVIYESLDGKAWKRGMGMPSYDQVFQGF